MIRAARSLALGLLLFLSASSFAQQPVKPESFHTLTWVGDPQWSPVDDRIVFTTRISNEKREGYDANLWIIGADGKGMRQLTYATASDQSARWSEDGREILFVSSRGGSAQAWVLPAEGGEARCVTPFSLDVSDVRWIPGARAISFLAGVPPTASTGRKTEKDMVKVKDPDLEKGVRVIRQAIYRAGKSYFEGKRPHLFTLDLAGGEIRQLTAGEMSVGDYEWSPDGKRVVVGFDHLEDATDIGRAKLRLLDRSGAWIRDLNDKPGYYGLAAWRPGSTQVVVTQDFPEGLNQK
ncbi:MAG: TolB family protein, partial [Nevskiales bacterium]